MPSALQALAPTRRPGEPEPAATAPTAPAVLLVPAMGVPVGFYQPFLTRLGSDGAAAEVHALELPGQGTSTLRARRGVDYGYREIVEDMLPDAVERIARAAPQRPLVVIGHSLGGQLSVLACATLPRPVERLVLIAAGTAHWRAWPQGRRLRAALSVHGIAAVAALLPWYPGTRLGFGGDQARRFMRDWSYNARTGRYRLEGSTIPDAEFAQRLAAARPRVHLLSVDGDPVAPPGAADELLGLLPSADVSRATVRGVASDSPWRRHFSWARRLSDVDDAVAAQLAAAGRAARPRPLADALRAAA